MRLLRHVICILSCAILVTACSQNETVFHDTRAQTVQLSTLKGKWVIINYWAEWCHACVVEVAEFNKFSEHNSNKNILLYGVNYDHLTGDALDEAVKKLKMKFPVIVEDPNQAWQLGDMEVLPTTFIIDPNGKVAKKIVGVSTEKSLSEALKSAQEFFNT